MIDRVSAAGLAAAVHLLLSALLVLWSIVLAGRIARRRDVPPALVLLSGLGGLLVAPAAFVEAMTGSVVTGRALYAVAWLWPAASIVMLAQAVLATVRGYLPRATGAVFIAYDLLVAILAVVRYAMLLGGAPAHPLVVLSAAEAGALHIVAGALATGHPLFFFPPVLAPAVPVRSHGFRFVVNGAAVVALLTWSTMILLALPAAAHAVRSFRPYALDRLQERPAADFAIGARLFPTVQGFGPPDLAVVRDVGLARELGLTALGVHIAPGAVTEALVDSIAAAIDEPRRAGALLVAVLAVSDARDPAVPHDAAWRAARLREMEILVRRLRPDYVVPAAPADAAPRRVTIGAWIDYLDAAARVARRTRPRTLVMLPLSGFTARDSALYAWAGRTASPIDATGFRIAPSVHGGAGLAARLLAAERWMTAPKPRAMEHWILETSGWPAIFGERNQERAVWGTLAWASRQPSMHGMLVHAAGDYGAPVGLRAVSGRVRPAGRRLAGAVNALSESAERSAPEPTLR
jgi:hypothetical protein